MNHPEEAAGMNGKDVRPLPGKETDMRILYEKREILFVLLWILVYCSVMAPIRGSYGFGSIQMLLALLAFLLRAFWNAITSSTSCSTPIRAAEPNFQSENLILM